MATNQSFNLPQKSQDSLVQYHKRAYEMMNQQWNFREQMRQIDLHYIREKDLTPEQLLARIANKNGDADRYQNITVPVIKPQVAAAVAYQAAIFLSDYPIFEIVSDPTQITAAKQMQALIEENSIRGGWTREFLLFLWDGFKYNLSAIEVIWDKIVTPALETDLSYKGGKEGKPVDVVWQGNCIKRWSMYNTYWDTRVIPYDIPSKGEFAGHTELMSRTALKSFIASLDTKLIANIVPAFESPSTLNVTGTGSGIMGYYIPQINPEVIIDPANVDNHNWDAWVGLVPASSNGGQRIAYKGVYEVSTEYIRLIPEDHGLIVPARNTPQVWKLIIVNHSVIIYAERQTNAHEKIPVFFGQPSEDGLDYQTKSLASDGQPFQQVASAILNSVIASRRRSITDRVLFDPSRVSEKHMNSPNPSAKIPVRPSAYGKPVGESVYQFPYRDDQASVGMGEIQSIIALGNVLNGQNPARQGQFVKGNKTDGQWESTMSNATSQDQLTALKLEAQVFTPIKEVLKYNYMQYQAGTTIYSPNQKQNVQVDPIALRKAILAFKMTDGLLPSEKVISADALKVGMQVIGSSPAIAQSYNIAPLFSYIMKAENVDLEPFEKSEQQVAYEQAMGQWSQMAQLAIQKGAAFSVPQPVPAQYGYDPAKNDPEEAGENSPDDSQTGQSAKPMIPNPASRGGQS
jgi:hypothetical protein